MILVSRHDTPVKSLLALLLIGLTIPAQASACTPVPAVDVSFTLKHCEVLRRGQVMAGLAWEIQQVVVEPPRQGSGNLTLRLAVIMENGEAVAWTQPDIGTPSAPEQLATPRGTLIRFPVSSRTSGRTLDEIWLRRAGLESWVHLDAQSWRSEAEQRLRIGETVATSFNITLRPLRARGRIARAGDQPCCPGGGTYTAWLELGEDRLILIGFSRH